MTSPRPASGRPASISKGKVVEPAVESPLHQSSFPAGAREKTPEIVSDADDDVIHIDHPHHHYHKVPAPDAGKADEEDWVVERGYSAPILASDEVAKNPEAEFMVPAVSPELERRDDDYIGNDPERRSASRNHSRSSSRNNNTQLNLQRVVSPPDHDRNNTPLEHLKEYEPLFPEDEDEKKPVKSVVDKFKRPELARHHFPSQDVWEDTPSSLQLETTVETPDITEDTSTPTEEKPLRPFRKPAPQKVEQTEAQKPLAKSIFNKGVLADVSRPGMQHRFPSQDVWEDAADHHYLVTTVSGPQTEETEEPTEPAAPSEKPQIPARPSIPPRPQKDKDISPVDKKAPGLPDKPKPSIPARPVRPATTSNEKVPTISAAQASLTQIAAQQPKAKPAVPARPGGSKIAALQAGFLKDLNSKLGLGPQAPKPKEPEPEPEEQAEVKPLQDARKGRAKGPQRRKPAASPAAPASEKEKEPVVAKLEFAGVSTVWAIGEDGGVDVPAKKAAEGIKSFLAGGKKGEEEQVETKDEKVDVEKEAVVPEVEKEAKDDVGESQEEPEKENVGIIGKVKDLATSLVSSKETPEGSGAKDVAARLIHKGESIEAEAENEVAKGGAAPAEVEEKGEEGKKEEKVSEAKEVEQSV